MAFTITPQLRGYIDEIKDQFESNIPYMYVDSVGNVTVGVGHNIDSHDDLTSLTFYVARKERKAVIGGKRGVPISPLRAIGVKATDQERLNDYVFLQEHKGLGKYTPEHLAAYTTLEMKSNDIDALYMETYKMRLRSRKTNSRILASIRSHARLP